MKISKVASWASGIPVSLSGITEISPQADLAANLLRPAVEPGYTGVGPTYQISGTPLTSAAAETYLYDPTEMAATQPATGHVRGTSATRRAPWLDLVNPGKGHEIGDRFTIVGTGTDDSYVTVVSVKPDGSIVDFIHTDGTNDLAIGDYTSGARTYGPVATVTVATATGTFVAGDILGLVQAGGVGCTLEVLTIDGSADIATCRVVTGGRGYHAATGGTVAILSGGGTECASARITIATILAAPTTATFRVNAVGTTTAATITAIDVKYDDCADHNTYKVWINRGGASHEVAIRGRYGKITDGSATDVTPSSVAMVAGTTYALRVSAVDLGARYTVLTVTGDTPARIATGYISARGSGYAYNDVCAIYTLAGVDTGCAFTCTQVDEFTGSSGTITFLTPTISATLASVTDFPVKPHEGDILSCVEYSYGSLTNVFAAAQLGAAPTVHANSTSTGAPIVQVANPVAGALKTVTLGDAGGDAYEVGDILDITQAGASGGKVIVLTLSTAAVATVAVIQGGSGYTAEADLATVNNMAGSDDACTITVSAVAAAGEYVTRLVTTTYGISGTAPAYTVAWVHGADGINGIPRDGELVRVAHTFALNNVVPVNLLKDSSAYVDESYEVIKSGALLTLGTDFLIKGGLGPVGSVFPIGQVTTVTATAAAGDIVEVTQVGASGGRLTIETVDGSADVLTATIQAAGTGYYAATGLGVTKVSGDGTVHSAIRVTLLEADIDATNIFFKDGYELAEGDVVYPVVKSNALAILKGDVVEFDSSYGGYNYTYFLPGADTICMVAYG